MPQVIVEGQAATARSMGKSDTGALRTSYAGSPIHSGDYTDAKAKAEMRTLLLSTVTVPGDGDFDLTFSGAPNLGDVAHGGTGGQPASPYVPNPASSPTGLAADQPAAPEGFGAEARTIGYGSGPTADAADRNPTITSPANVEKGISRVS